MPPRKSGRRCKTSASTLASPIRIHGDQHQRYGDPWLPMTDPNGAAIYGVPWIPSIYPSHVSIYTSTMDPMMLCLWENDAIFEPSSFGVP